MFLKYDTEESSQTSLSIKVPARQLYNSLRLLDFFLGRPTGCHGQREMKLTYVKVEQSHKQKYHAKLISKTLTPDMNDRSYSRHITCRVLYLVYILFQNHKHNIEVNS